MSIKLELIFVNSGHQFKCSNGQVTIIKQKYEDTYTLPEITCRVVIFSQQFNAEYCRLIFTKTHWKKKKSLPKHSV